MILLDNLSVPDALALFLSQRTKTLRDILHPESSAQTRPRRDSRLSVRSINRERDEIGSVLGESVKSLLETDTLAREVFGKESKTESLIDELQRLVQVGEPLPSPTRETGPKRTSHERRASRLASISISVPPISASPLGPPVSAPRVLYTLPSAQILLRHLPTAITGFTPFIAASPAPALNDSLRTWQGSSIDLLRESSPEWLGALNSVADIWHVRADLNALLQDGEVQSEIKRALEKEWGKRIEVVWEKRLEEVVRLAEDKTREAGEEVRTNGDENGTFRVVERVYN